MSFFTNDPTLVLRIALWALMGAVITPVIYTQKGRDPRWGMIAGLVAGGIGSLFLLVPLWVLLSRPRKLCPKCENPVLADADQCPHCDHVFDPPAGRSAAIRLGYPELAPLILMSMVATIVLLPLIYRGYTFDPAAWLLGGAVLGALIGVFALEILWLVAPRAGKRCPQCGAGVAVVSSVCPQCGFVFSDTIPESAGPDRASPLSAVASRLPIMSNLWSRLADMRWPWFVASALIVGLVLAQVGLAVPLVSSTRSGSDRVLPAIGIPPTPRPGLGVSRTTAQAQLSVQGFVFQPYVDESGTTGVLGRNTTDETLIYLMGPRDSVHTMAITVSSRADLPPEVRARQEENLEAVLGLAILDDEQAAQVREWLAAQNDIEHSLRADTLIGSKQISMWYDSEEQSTGISITATE